MVRPPTRRCARNLDHGTSMPCAQNSRGSIQRPPIASTAESNQNEQLLQLDDEITVRLRGYRESRALFAGASLATGGALYLLAHWLPRLHCRLTMRRPVPLADARQQRMAENVAWGGDV